MQSESQKTYDRINNSVYETNGNTWWQPDSLFYLMKVLFNPVRVNYSRTILFDHLKIIPNEKYALEVGCGGGVLSEEISKMGFYTTGIDPSEESINTARQHCALSGLNINYIQCYGESLPFKDNQFDIVFCCDVLEHVRNLSKVISEISRVLIPGGVFIYDTFNRTLISKLTAIKILQDWKRWAIMPKDLHVWKMFIRPAEIKFLLNKNQLEWKEHCGIRPTDSIPKVLCYLRKRAKGKLSYREFGTKFQLTISNKTDIMYMGYAIKNK